MYEIELPSGLAQFTSAREGKGGAGRHHLHGADVHDHQLRLRRPVPGRLRRHRPRVGDARRWLDRVLGGLAFSATFASPFFVLALFPTLLKKLPKSGAWLNSVKVVMGFLELAAALKFFRAGELVCLPDADFFTFDFVPGPVRRHRPAVRAVPARPLSACRTTRRWSTSACRACSSALVFLAWLYLLPGLFKVNDKGESNRPRAWSSPGSTRSCCRTGRHDIKWERSLEKGLAAAKGRGAWCSSISPGRRARTASQREERVHQAGGEGLLLKYVRVQLYTDVVPSNLYSDEELRKFGGNLTAQTEEAHKNRAFQAEKFNDSRLPLYAILQAEG